MPFKARKDSDVSHAQMTLALFADAPVAPRVSRPRPRPVLFAFDKALAMDIDLCADAETAHDPKNGQFTSGSGGGGGKSDEPKTVGTTAIGSKLKFVQEFSQSYKSGAEKTERLKSTPSETLQKAHKAMKGHEDPSTNHVRQYIEAEAKRRGLALDEMLALDRAPDNRFYDADGHLHIRKTPISKANVCPYMGKEIPDFEALGLDAEKVYQLYRHPDELAKGAASFNNKPLLSDHIPITLEEPNRDKWAGSLGSEAVFEAPYLYNSIAVWDKPSIKDVESEAKRELSAGYRYTADMTPGEVDGVKYDGVMREITANHVSFVSQGRAGADVMAADAALKTKEPNIMKTALKSRKALLLLGVATGAVRPKLAQDAKIDLSAAFAGVTAKNFKTKKPSISGALKIALDGKMKEDCATDATVDEVMELLDACEGESPAGADEVSTTAASSAVPVKTGEAEDESDDDDDPKRKFLKEKLSAEDMKAFDEMNEEAEDEAEETEEEKKAKMAKEAKDKAAAKDKKAKDAQPKTMDAAAMDAALADQRKSILAEQRAIRDAEAAVRKDPRVGQLHIAVDSAADVYGAALKHMGVKITGIPAEGFRAMFEAMPQQETRRAVDPELAMDGATTKAFESRFPGADRIATL